MADAIKAAMQALMKENAARPNSGHRPPNLHPTEDTHRNCLNCIHYTRSMCSLYDYRVQPTETCDSWSPLPN